MFYGIMRLPISPPNWFGTVSLNWELISQKKKKKKWELQLQTLLFPSFC